MLRIFGRSIIDCMLILFTVLVHKIIFRMMHLGYSSLFLYWGTFVGIYFVFQIITRILLDKRQ